MINGSIINSEQIRENVNILSEQITTGVWHNRENVLSKKVDILISNILTLHPAVIKEDINLAKSIRSLDGIVTTLSQTSKRVNHLTMQALHLILQGERLPGNLFSGITKNLPADAAHFQESLAVLIKLRDIYPEEGTVALANWISYQHIALSKLGLPLEELKPVFPHLTFATFDFDPMSEEDIQNFMQTATKLETLVFQNNNVEKLPTPPASLKTLIIRSEGLQEVEDLNEGLTSFTCNGDVLTKLPRVLPQNLEEFNISECPRLVNIPALNENLRKFALANSPNVELPYHLNPGLIDFDCSKTKIQRLPVLGNQLRNIECTDCSNLIDIFSLPNSLESLDCRRCENLESVVPSPNLKKIYINGSPKVKVLEPPKGLNIKQ